MGWTTVALFPEEKILLSFAFTSGSGACPIRLLIQQVPRGLFPGGGRDMKLAIHLRLVTERVKLYLHSPICWCGA